MDRIPSSPDSSGEATPETPSTLPLHDFDIATRSSLDLRALPNLGEIAADMNSRDANPFRSDGGKPLFAIENTYRRENTPQNTPETVTEQPPPNAEHPLQGGPEVPRDRQAILHLVRMRVLSFDQLARLTYFNANKTVARRRLRRLRDRGWIDVWERPVAQGGAPRYAYPTKRALLWGHTVTSSATEGTVLDRLVELMTPATPRQPWKLEAGIIPMFLAHTEEANDMLIAWLRRSGERVLWASSWDCPFPEHIEWRTMPQPDYVLVIERDGAAHLVFGEHDRGTEAREVVARKFRVYRTWIETPEIAERTFGFRAFHVFVTVSGERAPRRLDQLAQLAREEGIETFTTFLLSDPDATPVLTSLTPTTMDFTHCRLCQTRVPLAAEACPSCGAPTHQLARDDLTAEASPPPIEHAAEIDAPDIEMDLSAPPPLPPF
jgi:hypothetical protein